jgi:hypothetical protein
LVLLDYILDHRLPRGILRATVLFGYEGVQMALKRVAPAITLIQRAQVDRRAQITLRGIQIVEALRGGGKRFGNRRSFLAGELDLR